MEKSCRIPTSVLALDYRGYGRSEGRPSEAGLYRDARAAYQFVREEQNVAAQDIFALGVSLGAAVAGQKDRMIPMELGHALFSAAPQPKRFLALDEYGHDDFDVLGEEYFAAVAEFISRT